jgi:hypothetical protein
MAKVYKIHPGVGVARVGPSKEGFFLAREAPGAAPIDIDTAGREIAFAGYKDSSKLIRRQAARFRVYEYDRDDATGRLILRREITADDASIFWSVSLVSGKAEGREMVSVPGADGRRMIVPGAEDRNSPPQGFKREDLKASVTLKVDGKNAGPAPGGEPMGTILGKDLFIGDARTDAVGRLVVLAGRGHAASWATPPRQPPDYLNNPTWYDDIADGSVDATITFQGHPPVIAEGAWVITAPPDFAPDMLALTTLFDIAEQAANVPLPQPLTYPQDIEPILRRAADLHFVNTRQAWADTRKNLQNLPGLDDNGAAFAANRKKARDDLVAAENQMSDYRLTERQKRILELWVAGSFQSQADVNRPAHTPAAALDRANLEACIGGGFFPGIETGTVLRQPSIYSEMGRLVRGSFTDHDGSVFQLHPGLISSRMACPWQADFVECCRNWWPAQRPDITGRTAGGLPAADWHRVIVVNDDESDPQSHQNMVDHFAQLGVIVKSGSGFIEIDRDPSLDTGV